MRKGGEQVFWIIMCMHVPMSVSGYSQLEDQNLFGFP